MELATVVGLLQQDADDEIDDEIQKLVDERQEARKARNFARADEIRDMLKERGITLKDTPQGVQIIKEEDAGNGKSKGHQYHRAGIYG